MSLNRLSLQRSVLGFLFAFIGGFLVCGIPASADEPPIIKFEDLVLDGLTIAGLPAIAGAVIEDEPDCTAPAGDPLPATPEWLFRDRVNRYCAIQGMLDRMRNPAIEASYERSIQERATADPSQLAGNYAGDPFREPLTRWHGIRGRYQSVQYHNRAGEIRYGAIFRPLTESPGPYPGVMLICHVCAPEVRRSLSHTMEGGDTYIWGAQELAERGYMVFTAPTFTANNNQDALDFFLATPTEPTARGEFNPLWAELDRNRIGLTGHSGAASGAFLLGQTDSRVSAVVSWDRSRSFNPLGLNLRTPSLMLTNDYFYFDETYVQTNELPTSVPPDKYADIELFRAAGVHAMQVAIRGSMHNEVARSYPPSNPPTNCGHSRHGQRFYSYYMNAWFDRYLKGADNDWMARDALARLTAGIFDDSVDGTSIGMGTFDPALAEKTGDVEAGNVPVTIKGLAVADALSFYHPSGYFLGDGKPFQCTDIRSGLNSGECRPFPRPGDGPPFHSQSKSNR